MTTPQTAQQLVQALKAGGLSQADIARALDRSADLVSLVARGVKPGNNLTGALSNLLRTGTTVAPARRVSATGAPVRVRAPGGATVVPTPAARPARGKYGVDRAHASGRTFVRVSTPKSRGKGRDQASAAVGDELRRYAGKRSVRMVITTRDADGNTHTIKRAGYKATTLSRRLRMTYGGDAWQMIADMGGEDSNYSDADMGDSGENIVGVELEFY